MKRLTLVVLFALSGCLQPLHRYSLSPIVGSDEERTTALARAFAAAGAEPEVVDPRLAMVASTWQTPFGSNQGSTWTRRWVATFNQMGAVTIRAEIKICRTFQGCTDIKNEASEPDIDALDEFAHEVARSLNVSVTVDP